MQVSKTIRERLKSLRCFHTTLVSVSVKEPRAPEPGPGFCPPSDALAARSCLCGRFHEDLESCLCAGQSHYCALSTLSTGFLLPGARAGTLLLRGASGHHNPLVLLSFYPFFLSPGRPEDVTVQLNLTLMCTSTVRTFSDCQ